MRIDSQRPVRCLIQASDIARMHSLVETSVETSIAGRSAVQIDYLEGQNQIPDKLTKARYKLIVLTPDSPHEQLPQCLLDQPELSILVVTPSAYENSVDHWIRQGATDIVSQDRYDHFGHVFRRMLNECVLRTELEIANNQLAAQNRLQELLLNTQTEALLLWQNGQALQTNTCLNELIDCSENDNLTRTIQWTRWISRQTLQILAQASTHSLNKTIITNNAGIQYHAWIEHLVLNEGPAQLIRINPEPITDNQLPQSETDSVTGLFARSAFVLRWQLWLDSLHNYQRYTAMLITLPDVQSESGCDGIDGTMQDLLAYRASNAIEQHFGQCTMVGRTNKNCLLLVQLTERSTSRKSAMAVKTLLGSLGGLIDDPASIIIKTLTLSPTSLSANDVLRRLEHAELLTGSCLNLEDYLGQCQNRTSPCQASSSQRI